MTERSASSSFVRTVAVWSALGGLCGVGVPTLLMGGELIRRLVHVARGGGGETGSWGEPLFYMLLAWIPFGLAGSFVGGIGGALKHRARDRRASLS